jgi:thermitase
MSGSRGLPRLAAVVGLAALLGLLVPGPLPSARAEPAASPSEGLVDSLLDLLPVTGQILVKFRDNMSDSQIDSFIASQGDTSLGKVLSKERVVGVLGGLEVNKILAYLTHPLQVEFAELNGRYPLLAAPNDPGVSKQWHLNNTGQSGGTSGDDLDAFSAWDATTGSSGIQVAILDTGIDLSHEDLKSKISKSTNFATNTSTADDKYGHGTHISGIVAATGNNGIGVAGICQKCMLLNVKVMDDSGAGQWDWIANGIGWAADNGAEVINLSLGNSTYSDTLNYAVQYAWSKGVVVVAAAGNNGNSTKTYPAALDNVIAVASTDASDKRASSSNYGSWVDVAAPGVDIYSTAPDTSSTLFGSTTKYGTKSGTSMAAAMVSGLAGLVFSSGKCSGSTINACVRDRILKQSDSISGTGSQFTYGRVNAYKALH